MSLQTQKALIGERPNQVYDTAFKSSPQEFTAMEAIKAGLYSSGIDHDQLDFFADGCLLALKGTGLLNGAPTPAEVIQAAAPGAEVDVQHSVHRIGGSRLTIAQAANIAKALTGEFKGAAMQHSSFEAVPERHEAFGVFKVEIDPQTKVNIFYGMDQRTEGV